jgi:hypothetical protein
MLPLPAFLFCIAFIRAQERLLPNGLFSIDFVKSVAQILGLSVSLMNVVFKNILRCFIAKKPIIKQKTKSYAVRLIVSWCI